MFSIKLITFIIKNIKISKTKIINIILIKNIISEITVVAIKVIKSLRIIKTS